MARWRLTNKHYLNVPGTEWEYSEVTNTGKRGKKNFPVPLYLDPGNPGDQNYPGEIIVAHAESAQFPRDIIFVGPPTPDMEPLDQEAIDLTTSMQDRWQHPIESLPANGSGSMLPPTPASQGKQYSVERRRA